ncbi:MAG: hypothetical protein O6846_02955 [Thaumarchaeota archaeon]|nr:hypothetical protein [Nitrososphaerota archaeon]
MPAVVSHIIGTVALLSMMLVMANIFTAFGGFVTNKAHEVELDETAAYIGNHITQLVGIANFSNGAYVIKRLDLPDDIGNFAYTISIEGPDPPPPLGITTLTHEANISQANNGWTNVGNAFLSDNLYAQSNADGDWVVYSGFDLGIPSGAVIHYVKITGEHFEDTSGITYILVQASDDGGTSFLSPSHPLPTLKGAGNEATSTIDITSDTIWSPSNLNTISIKFLVNSRTPVELAYKSKTGSNDDKSPKVRDPLGNFWGPEIELEKGRKRIWAVRMAYNPVMPSEFIVVTLGDDKKLNAYVCDNGSCNLTEEIGRVEDFKDDSALPFDIEYEFASGRALLVYGVREGDTDRDLAYRIWDGNSWSSELYIDDTSHSGNAKYRSIALAQNQTSGSDILGLVGFDSDSRDIQAWRWNSSSWVDEFQITSTSSVTGSPYRQNVAIAFESISGNMLAVGGHSSSGEVAYAIYESSAGSWTPPVLFDTDGSSTADVEMLTLKANPINDEMMLVVLTDDRGLHTARWTGNIWNKRTDHNVELESKKTRGADGDWEPDGGRYVLWYGKRGASDITRRIFTNSWGPVDNTQLTPLSKIEWVTARRGFDSSTSNQISVALMYEALDLYTFAWNGTNYKNIQLISSSMVALNYEGYDLAYKPVPGSGLEAKLDQVSIEVRYEIVSLPPVSSGETYTIVVKSDRNVLRTGNFTLPWNAFGRLVFSPNASLPEGVSLSEIPSGIRRPLIWTIVNSTHITFGFGSR